MGNSRTGLTAFVREILIPGGPDAVPRIVRKHCRFPLRYAPSKVHRWGIFSKSDIPAGRRVIEYTGAKIGQAEVRRRNIRPNLYLFVLNTRTVIDGAIGGSGAEYINHSCGPNLYASVARGHIWFVSLRPIEAGDELLLDYRIQGNYPMVKCRCGSPNCRGFLNLPPSLEIPSP